MTWRFVAAGVATVVLLGLSIEAAAQDPAKAAQPVEPEKAAEAVAKQKDSPDAAKTPAPAAKSKKNSPRSKTRPLQPDNSTTLESHLERATFGAGCFWHVEHTFEMLPGVVSAVSGYAGGRVRFPSYEMVQAGDTGHAEVVMVQYDPEVIAYEKLLKVFWSCHDPTTPNQQGPDIGPEYRSIILYHNETQRKAALESYQDLVEKRAFRRPIVTELVPLKAFYRAEDYHQDYYGGKPHPTTAARRHKTTVSRAKGRTSAANTASPSAPEETAKPTESAASSLAP
jgi:peptide-methionine (S)-S-oxide reductase